MWRFHSWNLKCNWAFFSSKTRKKYHSARVTYNKAPRNKRESQQMDHRSSYTRNQWGRHQGQKPDLTKGGSTRGYANAPESCTPLPDRSAGSTCQQAIPVNPSRWSRGDWGNLNDHTVEVPNLIISSELRFHNAIGLHYANPTTVNFPRKVMSFLTDIHIESMPWLSDGLPVIWWAIRLEVFISWFPDLPTKDCPWKWPNHLQNLPLHRKWSCHKSVSCCNFSPKASNTVPVFRASRQQLKAPLPA